MRSDGAEELSAWTRSVAKRAFDVGIVLIALPLLAPVLACIALAVFATSGAPILFLQVRVGRNGRLFAIYKFRTMRHEASRPLSSLAVGSADRVTRLGTWLRRTKLDELPQVFNILAGEMSLVGPRPKVPEQQPGPLACRPGLTGAATLEFAREEALLKQVPEEEVNDFFNNTILPVKRRLDADYMQRATMTSDLALIANTVLGRWQWLPAEPSSWPAGRIAEQSVRFRKQGAPIEGHSRGAQMPDS
ncbi:MAG TPA: sugar transferase [Terracidiphilus sp.]|nr:sugar transferase [Terracidiphilus sp.]